MCLLIGSIAAKDQLCSDCPGCLTPKGQCREYNPKMAKVDSKGNSMTRKQFSEGCIKNGGIDCSETNLGCKLSEECSVSKPYCRQSVCYECIGDIDCSHQKPYCSANKCVAPCPTTTNSTGGSWLLLDGKCYLYDYNELVTKNEAIMYCDSKGGFVFEPNSEDESSLVWAHKDWLGMEQAGHIWIGLTQMNDAFEWDSGMGSRMGTVRWTNWGSSQPNDACVYAYIHDSTWYDKNCSQKDNVLCEAWTLY